MSKVNKQLPPHERLLQIASYPNDGKTGQKIHNDADKSSINDQSFGRGTSGGWVMY